MELSVLEWLGRAASMSLRLGIVVLIAMVEVLVLRTVMSMLVALGIVVSMLEVGG
jgi:hypothetical protein